MPFFDLVILALIQGITEFLPISSSGHLVLAHLFLQTNDHSALLLDIAVHIGTLFAVILYFRRDLANILCGLWNGICSKNKNHEGLSLFLKIIIGSLPVICAGFLIHLYTPTLLRSAEIMAWMTLIFGVLLGLADRFSPQHKKFEDITYRDSLIIGLSQMLALIPGTSRSGITMTTARMIGIERLSCARFSLLLAIIAISGAGLLGGLDVANSHNVSLGIDMAAAALFSFIAALAAIALMMKWLEKASFMPFVIYRVILGCVLLGLIYSGVLAG